MPRFLHDIPSEDGVIDVEFFTPDKRPDAHVSAPAAILFTDIRGSRPVYTRLAERLSALGVAVLLPNLYYRGGRAPVVDPTLPVQDADARARRQALRAALTPEALSRDFEALVAFLDSRPDVDPARLGVVGYCMSGAFAVRLAAQYPDRVRAAASFHGGGLASDAEDSPHRLARRLRTRLYFGHADQDASMPAEAVALLEKTFSDAGVDFISEIYDARHGFAIEDAAAYDPDASNRHFRAIETLFGATLLKPASLDA